jgi:hypothetical protein
MSLCAFVVHVSLCHLVTSNASTAMSLPKGADWTEVVVPVTVLTM